MKQRHYKIYNNGVAYFFTTPEELDSFVKKSNVKAAEFTIVDVEHLSSTCSKETEILKMSATF